MAESPVQKEEVRKTPANPLGRSRGDGKTTSQSTTGADADDKNPPGRGYDPVEDPSGLES